MEQYRHGLYPLQQPEERAHPCRVRDETFEEADETALEPDTNDYDWDQSISRELARLSVLEC